MLIAIFLGSVLASDFFQRVRMDQLKQEMLQLESELKEGLLEAESIAKAPIQLEPMGLPFNRQDIQQTLAQLGADMQRTAEERRQSMQKSEEQSQQENLDYKASLLNRARQGGLFKEFPVRSLEYHERDEPFIENFLQWEQSQVDAEAERRMGVANEELRAATAYEEDRFKQAKGNLERARNWLFMQHEKKREKHKQKWDADFEKLRQLEKSLNERWIEDESKIRWAAAKREEILYLTFMGNSNAPDDDAPEDAVARYLEEQKKNKIEHQMRNEYSFKLREIGLQCLRERIQLNTLALRGLFDEFSRTRQLLDNQLESEAQADAKYFEERVQQEEGQHKGRLEILEIARSQQHQMISELQEAATEKIHLEYEREKRGFSHQREVAYEEAHNQHFQPIESEFLRLKSLIQPLQSDSLVRQIEQLKKEILVAQQKTTTVLEQFFDEKAAAIEKHNQEFTDFLNWATDSCLKPINAAEGAMQQRVLSLQEAEKHLSSLNAVLSAQNYPHQLMQLLREKEGEICSRILNAPSLDEFLCEAEKSFWSLAESINSMLDQLNGCLQLKRDFSRLADRVNDIQIDEGGLSPEFMDIFRVKEKELILEVDRAIQAMERAKDRVGAERSFLASLNSDAFDCKKDQQYFAELCITWTAQDDLVFAQGEQLKFQLEKYIFEQGQLMNQLHKESFFEYQDLAANNNGGIKGINAMVADEDESSEDYQVPPGQQRHNRSLFILNSESAVGPGDLLQPPPRRQVFMRRSRISAAQSADFSQLKDFSEIVGEIRSNPSRVGHSVAENRGLGMEGTYQDNATTYYEVPLERFSQSGLALGGEQEPIRLGHPGAKKSRSRESCLFFVAIALVAILLLVLVFRMLFD